MNSNVIGIDLAKNIFQGWLFNEHRVPIIFRVRNNIQVLSGERQLKLSGHDNKNFRVVKQVRSL